MLSQNGFGGIDQRAGCSTALKSFTELVNFEVQADGGLKKRNGYRALSTPDGVGGNLLWSDGGTVLMANGNEVYRLYGENFLKIGETANSICSFLNFGEKVYALANGLYSISGSTVATVEGYVPLIATACAPNGAGTAYESPNMLTPKRRIRYNGDGFSCTYTLPEKDIDCLNSITINGVELTSSFECDAVNGYVNFGDAPSEGVNNVEICYSAKPNTATESLIKNCRYGTVFENRLFLYGNSDYPNYIFRSSLADGIPSAEYFAETDYHVFDSPVTAMCGCYNRLIVFSEKSASYTYSQLVNDTLGNSLASFPVYELSGSKGALTYGNCISYGNMPITLCEDGLNRWSSTEIADERAAKVFSQRIYKYTDTIKQNYSALKMLHRKNCSELWFVLDDGVMVYNYGLDCFYYYSIPQICGLCEINSDVVFCRKDGAYLFTREESTDAGEVTTACFTTPFCSFGSPYSLKDLNGLSLTLVGEGGFTCGLTVERGNRSECQQLSARLTLPEAEGEACRRIRERLHLKRFYSCKLRLSTCSDQICISDLHLFGKIREGGLRSY